MITIAEFENAKRKIESDRKLTDMEKRMALNSLKRRFEKDNLYNAVDESGFSQSDKDRAEAERRKQIKRAIELGVKREIAELMSATELERCIYYKTTPITFKYDESEVGSEGYKNSDYGD